MPRVCVRNGDGTHDKYPDVSSVPFKKKKGIEKWQKEKKSFSV